MTVAPTAQPSPAPRARPTAGKAPQIPEITGRTGDSALARCVARPAQEFADGYWGRAPLLSRAAEFGRDGVADLFDATAVDELVSSRGLRTPFLRMAKDGTVLPSARFTRGGGAGASVADQAADDRILAALADGTTLVLQGLHRTWPPLVEFTARLAEELGHPAQINAYITPPQNQGFAPHYDVHDVFVLQVAGRKRWVIHEPVVDSPLDNQPWDKIKDRVAERAAQEPLIDTVLEPGDAVYLPRGTIHSAEALGEVSIHLTIGVHPLTRYHLVRQLLEAVQDEPALRGSLPMGVDLSDPGVLSTHLAETVEALQSALAEVSADRIGAALGKNLMQRTRPVPIGPLAQLAAADAVTGATPLHLRPALRLRTDAADGKVRIVLLDRTVELPAATSDAVKTAVSGDTFLPGDLPGLDAGEQLVLVKRLIREGVLVPA